MDKGKRQKRLIQKVRNLTKWLKRERVKAKREGVRFTERREKIAKIEANHGKLCSCQTMSCGNPRHHHYVKASQRLTLQERKANEKFSSEIEEAGE